MTPNYSPNNDYSLSDIGLIDLDIIEGYILDNTDSINKYTLVIIGVKYLIE